MKYLKTRDSKFPRFGTIMPKVDQAKKKKKKFMKTRDDGEYAGQ